MVVLPVGRGRALPHDLRAVLHLGGPVDRVVFDRDLVHAQAGRAPGQRRIVGEIEGIGDAAS